LAVWGIIIGSSSALVGIAPALFGNVLDKPSMSFVWFFACTCLALFFVGFPRRFLDLTKKPASLVEE
jgi:hypothetical protein